MVAYTVLKENWKNFLKRDKGLKGLKASRHKVSLTLMKGFKWELIQLFLFFEPDPKIEIFFEKRGGSRRKQC